MKTYFHGPGSLKDAQVKHSLVIWEHVTQSTLQNTVELLLWDTVMITQNVTLSNV